MSKVAEWRGRRRAETARKNIEKQGLTNVVVIKGDFMRHSIRDATVLYCLTDLTLKDFASWSRRTKTRTLRIVTLGPPPVPIKPVATKGSFCLTRFPYECAKTSAEWYDAVMGSSNASWTQFRRKFKKLSPEAMRSLRHDLKRHFG